MARSFLFFIEKLIGLKDIKRAYYAVLRNDPIPKGIKISLLYYCFLLLQKMEVLDKLTSYYLSQNDSAVYDLDTLNFLTNSIFKQPEIVISNEAPKRVNVLVPAFNIKSISAGFFGVFQLAKVLAKMGYKVRLVLFDSFNFDKEIFNQFLQKTPDLEDLLDLVEVAYIGNGKHELVVSKSDFAIATVWYSAYLAEKIREVCAKDHFLYLVQDYEPGFFPHNSHYAFALDTYKMKSKKLFSTKTLMEFFTLNNVISKQETNFYFCNAASVFKHDNHSITKKLQRKEKICVLYARPDVGRNMFFLAALALIEAYKTIFSTSEYTWKFYGMGIGDVTIFLDEETTMTQLPRMSLQDYKNFIGDIDICLTLMATPHPSMIPMDIAGSGGIVVTNLMHNRTQEFYKEISGNIIAVEPSRDKIVNGLKEAIERLSNPQLLKDNIKINYPTSWEETWNDDVKKYLHSVLAD